MKTNILFLILIIFGGNICHGQFSEEKIAIKDNRFFIGGLLNFDKSENINPPIFSSNILLIGGNSLQNFESTSFNFHTNIGYQMNKHWVLGFELGLNKRSTENTGGDSNKQESTTVSYNLFSRYIINPDNKLQVFLNPSIGVSKFDSKIEFLDFNGAFEIERTINNAGISIGAQYSLADWIRVTTNVGGFYYSGGTDKNSNNFEMDFNSTGFRFSSSSIYFGMEFLF